VLAGGEVKSVLTKKDLERTIEASHQFKSLKAVSRNTLENSSLADLDRFSTSRPYFLFALQSSLTMPQIVQVLVEASSTDAGTRTDLVDAVFVLGESPAINYGDGQGRLRFRNKETGELRTGWIWQRSGSALLALMVWLSAVMPREIHFEPIVLLYLETVGLEKQCQPHCGQ